MIRKNLLVIFTFVSMSIILQGCNQPSDSNISKNTNAVQSVTNSDVNAQATNVNVSNTSEINNIVPGGNSAAVNKKPMSKASEPQPIIGSGGDDLSILLQARNKLNSDKELINSVIVEIKQGNATLTGSVVSDDQKKKAEQLVESVQGVKSVKNNLRVSS